MAGKKIESITEIENIHFTAEPVIDSYTGEKIVPEWTSWLVSAENEPEHWQRQELEERAEDLCELRFLLADVADRLKQYDKAYPDGRLELELSFAYQKKLNSLDDQLIKYEDDLQSCDLISFLELKYEIRNAYKQIGAILAASDWPSPCFSIDEQETEQVEESGYGQEEEGTYQRSYGSERVKEHEKAVQKMYYPVLPDWEEYVLCFACSSGMKALELALAAYKSESGNLPLYYQQGFYGEGIHLACLLSDKAEEMRAEEIYERLESNEPIGALLVDPGQGWPVCPAIELERLLKGLIRHRQQNSLYVIVDRTFITVTNSLFMNYMHSLPEHVVLVLVESGIKYMQYGMELANVGYTTAAGQRLKSKKEQERWTNLLAILDGCPDPMVVCQLPRPDLQHYERRLGRLNRNSYWVRSFLDYLAGRKLIHRYYSSISPSPQQMINGRPWFGTLYYIQLREEIFSETEYLNWIHTFVESAPDEMHFVSGGSFGFDSFRFNVVNDDEMGSAMRLSVGREPIRQLFAKLRFLYQYIAQDVSG